MVAFPSSIGITKGILLALGAGAVVGAALLFPGAGWVYKEFKKEQWEKAKRKGRLKATIKRLEEQELISWSEENGEIKLNLTEKGKKKVLKYKIEDMIVDIPDKWDGFWRVVVFDIPEEKKAERDVFRNKLKDMGLQQLQRSVFISRYDCKNQIDFLRHNLEISSHIHYIVAKEISNLELK